MASLRRRMDHQGSGCGTGYCSRKNATRPQYYCGKRSRPSSVSHRPAIRRNPWLTELTDSGELSYAFEVGITTHDFYNYFHELFVVAVNGQEYALDPTGVQFGANWPLLQEWEEFSQIWVKDLVTVLPLGAAAGLWVEYEC